MAKLEDSPQYIKDPFVEGEVYRTMFFDKAEMLEEYVHSWGFGEDNAKLVLSACCVEKPVDDKPRWETNEQFHTSASITSMLEIACLMNATSDEVPDYAEVIIDMRDGSHILTACFHSDPKIVEAGGAPYKVVIEDVAVSRRVKLE